MIHVVSARQERASGHVGEIDWDEIFEDAAEEAIKVGGDWVRGELAPDAPSSGPVQYVLPPGYVMTENGPVPTGGASASAGGGVPTWAWVGGLGVLAWFLFK